MVRLLKSGLSAAVAFALVMTVTLTARATEKAVETTKGKVVTVQLKTVEHNLESVVGALALIDPAWVDGLPKVKTVKSVIPYPESFAKALIGMTTDEESDESITPHIAAPRATQTYYYIGPAGDEGEIDAGVLVPSNWSTNQGTFNCNQATDIPCSLEVPLDRTISQYLNIDLDADSELIRDEASVGRNVG